MNDDKGWICTHIYSVCTEDLPSATAIQTFVTISLAPSGSPGAQMRANNKNEKIRRRMYIRSLRVCVWFVSADNGLSDDSNSYCTPFAFTLATILQLLVGVCIRPPSQTLFFRNE